MTSPLSPELVWGLLPRLVGLAFVLAFVSLSRQVVPLVGSRGVSPLRHRLARLRRDVPAPGRWFEAPTLFWLHACDRALAALPWVGALGGLLAVIGGPLGWWGLLLCWMCWLSLDVCGLWLPWDTLLHELGFLSLFLPATAALPELSAVAAPLPAVAFMARWLVIRLMWGFAKLKFVGTERGDGLYLQGFLTWLPLPTPFGWHAQKAPTPLLRAGCAFMWVAEVVAPLLACFPGTPRLVGCALLVALMIGIQATGNWGHFNLAYAFLCVVLLDTGAMLSDVWTQPPASSGATAVTAFMGALFLVSLVLFPLNSWVTQAALQWNADRVSWRRPWLERLLHVARLVNRLRLVGAYGVFPPNTSPPIKMVPVLEGRHDGGRWEPIPWRFMPVGERSPPRFVAPHHPRLDHSCIYVGLGLEEGDPLGGLMFEVKPHGMSPYSHETWLRRVVQRVLEGEPAIQPLLGAHPFGERPPSEVRVVHRALKPVSVEERRRSGRWWHARSMCVLHEPVRSDPDVWTRWLPEPEGVHPELAHRRRRSPALAALRAAMTTALLPSLGGVRAARDDATDLAVPAAPPGEAVAGPDAAALAPHDDDPGARAACRNALRAASDLTADDVDAFWDAFVPWARDPARADRWRDMARTFADARARFGAERVRVFERVHQRAVHVLEARVAPHVYGDARPHVPVAHAYQLMGLLGRVVLAGERAWREVWLDPGRLAAHAARFDEAARLYPLGLFRWPQVRSVALGLRARTTLSRAPDMPWGLGRHRAFLLALDVGPQWFPTCEKAANGAWTVPAEPFEAGDGPPEDEREEQDPGSRAPEPAGASELQPA